MRSTFRSISHCESTQEEARKILSKDPNIDIAWVLAEQMSQGRGRAGKKWECLEGNLFLSCAIRVDQFLKKPSQPHWPFVSLIGAYAWFETCCALKIWTDQMFIKWPNDIWALNEQGTPAKMGGMLAEIKGRVLCFGIGVNLVRYPESLEDYRATALLEVLNTNDLIDRKHLAEEFSRNFQVMFQKWLECATAIQSKTTEALWQNAMTHFKHMVFEVENQKGIWTPHALNEDGSLNVQDNSGKTLSVHAGELRIRYP